MVVKSFRGQIADRGQETISLHTNDGSTGYRILKFEVFPAGATSAFSYESFVSIFKIEQSTPPADGIPNFEDNTLLGCAYYTQSSSGATNPEDSTVVFDNEVFNQDIYVTHSNSESSAAINYYIELEQMKLDLNENTVATLKDIRNIKSQ
tara:strand:- start:42 stop:491 length:450 start_codon:yes stop_codon:yes gene_type:complete